MAKTFAQMAEEVMAQVQGISAEEAHQRLKQDPNALLVDVREAAEIASTGLVSLPCSGSKEVLHRIQMCDTFRPGRPVRTRCVGGRYGTP